MNQFFSILSTTPLQHGDFGNLRDSATKILTLIEDGKPVNRILESGILPPKECSALILKMITSGILSPVSEDENMTQKVIIVTDSAADLPPQLAAELGIGVVPLQVHINGETYRDGIDINPTTFYRLLGGSKVMPSTRPPTIEDFHKVFAEHIGSRDILCIHLSSKMSKTGDIAAQTIRKYFNAYLRSRKETTGTPKFTIEICNSGLVSMGTALLVLEAAEMARQGKTIEEITDRIDLLKEEVRVNFMVDKLDYLARGGRIGRGSAFLGNLFGLKPILAMAEGGVNAKSRSLGGRFAQRKLLESMKQELDPANQHIRIGICHGDCREKAQALMDQITELFPGVDCLLSDFGPTVGAHTGPGALGVAWLATPLSKTG